MTTKAWSLFLLQLALPPLPAPGQTNQPLVATAQPVLSPTEQAIQNIKHPVSWLSWGSDLRLRNEYFDNLLTLNPNNSLHEQEYFRFRARLWTSVNPVDDFSFNIRLASEPREWLNPAGYTPMKGRVGPDWTEGIFDTLNVQWKNALELPATLTVGRQDLFLGDGWLVGDGTPYDGSWTYYLDSARLVYELKEQHTTIETIGIIQDAHDDGWMPVINAGQHRIETEQNEKGAILSVANTSLRALNINPYFIYKHDNAVAGAPRGADNTDIYTMGARLTGLLGQNWKYSVEGAYQLGEKQDPTVQYPTVSSDYRAINAFGVNTKAAYLFKDKYNNQLSLSYEFLSGDDPNSKNDEMFDLLWGRWPRWSEIGLYSYAAETRVGQQANLHRFGPTWTVTPLKDLDFSASYFALFAPEQIPTREASPTLFSHEGNFRGHFAQAVLKYKFSRHLSGHLWSEFLFPGDYYVHNDLMTFLRAEIMLTF